MYKDKIKPIKRLTDDVYTVLDYKNDDIVLSVTHLNPGKYTRGHSHPNFEIYYFWGDGDITIGDETIKVEKGEFHVVPSNFFHRVMNYSSDILTFICVWKTQTEEKRNNEI